MTDQHGVSLRAVVRRLHFARAVAVLALFVAWGPPDPAGAQVRIPTEAFREDGELTRVLSQGHELEAQQRWADALAHYEQAVREFPDRRDLWERLTQARVHYELCRRYDDKSYTAWIAKLPEGDAREVYTEVLRKIDSHYVRPPDWQDLSRRGLDNFVTALAHPPFVAANRLSVSSSAIRAFGEELQQRMAVTVVRTPKDAVAVAGMVSQLAQQRLGLSPAAVFLEFTCGASCSLDQYSSFLTAGQLEDVFSQIEGNFVGLGIELKASDQALEIVGVIPGGPASLGGVRVGDRIIDVDGVSTSEVTTDEAADMLKGLEGSSVQLTLVDPQGSSRPLQLVRRVVEVPSVENARLLDTEAGIAYLKLSSFQKSTSRDMDTALWQLHRQGMRLLIVDLRGNPGGLLTAAVEVADRFVASGSIVSTRGRDAREDCDYRAQSAGTWRVPLIVLIDGETASASEIFAGAIRDSRRGTLIGERSYGKGSVQGIFSLSSSRAGIRLTTAKFYSPSGQAISDRGVDPDLLVQATLKPVGDAGAAPPVASDRVLDAATEYARRRASDQRQARIP